MSRARGDGARRRIAPASVLRVRRRLACFAAAASPVAAAAAAGTVTGVIHNGTNGNAVAPGVDVILIQLQGGMQPVANTKTDAKGNYKFDNPAIGQGPMLIRAVYHGVMFHQPLVPGTTPWTSPSTILPPMPRSST